MPGRNRMGPMGLGPMTGRGLGLCKPNRMLRGAAGLASGYSMARRGLGRRFVRRGAAAIAGRGLCRGAMMGLGLAGGLGLGLRYGWPRSGTAGTLPEKSQQEILQVRKEELESSLDIVNQQLEELQSQELS